MALISLTMIAQEKPLINYLNEKQYRKLDVSNSSFASHQIYCKNEEYNTNSLVLKNTWIINKHTCCGNKILIDQNNQELFCGIEIKNVDNHPCCYITLNYDGMDKHYFTLIQQKLEEELMAAEVSLIKGEIIDGELEFYEKLGFKLDDQKNALPLCKKIIKELNQASNSPAISKYQETSQKIRRAALDSFLHTQS